MTSKELAEALWMEYKAERDEKRRFEFYKPYILDHHTLETIYHLLRDYGSDSDVFPYVDYYVTELINPDALPLLDSAMLAETIPDFDWDGGHSGIVLADRQAQKLDALWHKHITVLKKEIKIDAKTRENDKAYIAD